MFRFSSHRTLGFGSYRASAKRRWIATFEFRSYGPNAASKVVGAKTSPLSSPRSVIIASTPDSITLADRRFKEIHEADPLIQLIVASFDTVGARSCRSGISEMWFDEYMTINDLSIANDSDDSASANWKHDQGAFIVQVPYLGKLEMALGNTLFHNSCFENLYIHQPDGMLYSDVSQRRLAEISLELPEVLGVIDANYETNLTPVPYKDDMSLTITDSKHNMIKSINGQPASSFLQDNDYLKSVITKDCKVFASVTTVDAQRKQYEVVGGGGASWGGVKSNLLALNPEPQMDLSAGSTVEFFHLQDKYRYKFKDDRKVVENAIVFNCSLEESGNANVDSSVLQTFDLTNFGIGSERGFILNGVKYNAHGDSISLSLCQ